MTGQEHLSGTDRVAEAARKCSIEPDDIVVNIQGDQPYFHPSLISDLIRPLRENPDIPMSTLQYRMTQEAEIQHPNNVKTVSDKKGFALFFSRARIPYCRDGEIRPLYFKHLGFYGYRMHFLETFSHLPVTPLEEAEKLEQLRALENGYKIIVIEVMHDSIEVDTPQDIRRVEAMMALRGESEL
jgi:3-deoxy-manno-octulosonate cytidylyltransferase (CMP-KDO synthetase)